MRQRDYIIGEDSYGVGDYEKDTTIAIAKKEKGLVGHSAVEEAEEILRAYNPRIRPEDKIGVNRE